MDLLNLRKQLRKTSGRVELVNEDGSDNGANFYIYEGQKHLDRLNETQKSWASTYKFIESGYSSTTFPYCRAIKEVWLSTIADGRWQADKKDLQDLKAEYLSGLPSSRTEGTPLYYSPGISRYVPEDETFDDFEAFVGFVDTPAGNAYEYNAILLNCPVNVKTMVEVVGLFYGNRTLVG